MKNTFGSSLTMWYTINMEKLYEIKLDRNSELPLYRQLAERILELRNSGELPIGTRLPPIRKLAAHVGVNKLTVVNTYKHLEKRKAIYSHVGSGTYITEEAVFAEYNDGGQSEAYHKFDMDTAINFIQSMDNADLFPVKAFRDAFNHVMDRDLGTVFSRSEPWGDKALREEVCKDLRRQDICADISEIQIVSTLGCGVEALSSRMLSEGDAIIIERPTFQDYAAPIWYRKALIYKVDMQEDGMDLEQLEDQLKTLKPKFIFIVSRFQIPTCYSYSLSKKQRLLELASKYDTYILEIDNSGEFVYGDEAKKDVKSLKALDTEGRVVFYKSYSKEIMPGLSIAVLVHSSKTKGLCRGSFGLTAPHPFVQRTFTQMLSSGDYYKHVANVKKTFESRYKTMIRAIDKNLSRYVEYKNPQGGLSLWLKLKDNKVWTNELLSGLMRRNVLVQAGSVYYPDTGYEETSYFSLSIAGVNETQIEEGIREIAQCLKFH